MILRGTHRTPNDLNNNFYSVSALDVVGAQLACTDSGWTHRRVAGWAAWYQYKQPALFGGLHACSQLLVKVIREALWVVEI